jgi:hypothetical protein
MLDQETQLALLHHCCCIAAAAAAAAAASLLLLLPPKLLPLVSLPLAKASMPAVSTTCQLPSHKR